MKNFELPAKIIWRRNSFEDMSKIFYPSFYRDLQKELPFFQKNFDFLFIDANPGSIRKYFLPLYETEVMARPDYALNKETIVQELLEKVARSDTYRLLYVSCQGRVVLATLFSLRDNGLFIGYRAYNRNFDKTLNRRATAAYWGEKLIFDYSKNQGVNFVSRGQDTHPFQGTPNIGRPLYKLKTGVRPKVLLKKKSRLVSLSENEIMTDRQPLLLFDTFDAEGFCQNGFLYYPKNTLEDSYINEFQKVFKWAEISFFPVPY